jgi:hypothetical protein
MKADWKSHKIEGYARAAQEQGIPAYFSAPLFSHIGGNLWVGGCVNGVTLPDDFRYVVSLYPWEKYTLGPKTERVEIQMYDSHEVDVLGLEHAADLVYHFMQEGKTLVHCQAGLNRSNLVAAAALMKEGHTADYAINVLREKRSPLVLCNRAFEDYLRAAA